MHGLVSLAFQRPFLLRYRICCWVFSFSKLTLVNIIVDFNQIPKQEKESLKLSELAMHREDLTQSLSTEERAIPLHSYLLNPGTWWKLFLTCLGLGYLSLETSLCY